MKKRIISIILALVMTLACVASCFAAATDRDAETVSATLLLENYSIPYDFQYDWKWFTQSDSTVFYQGLARLGLLLSYEVDGWGLETEGSELYGTDTLSCFDFDRIDEVSLGADSYDEDKDDLTSFWICAKTVSSGTTTTNVYMLAIQGEADEAQWRSNLDIGADSESYSRLDSSEWMNHDNHKGFDVTANRVLDYFNEFVDSYEEENASDAQSVFVTGHSRGGSIANIIAASLYDFGYNTYGYTFGALASECDADPEDYPGIFNFVNEDDMVTKFPCSSWGGFERYGTDLRLDMSVLEEEYLALFGEDYEYSDSETAETVFDLTDSREGLYEDSVIDTLLESVPSFAEHGPSHIYSYFTFLDKDFGYSESYFYDPDNVTASVFGTGGVIAIVTLGVVVLVAMVAVSLAKKGRKNPA